MGKIAARLLLLNDKSATDMDPRARLFRLIYILLIVLLFAAVVGFLFYYFSNIFLYLLIAAILSLMGRPLVKLLRKVRFRSYKIPDSLCALLTLLAPVPWPASM